MRGGIHLPQFADAGTLPAFDWRFEPWSGFLGDPFGQSKTAHGGAIQPEIEQTMHLLRGKCIRRGRFGGEPLAEQVRDARRPFRLVVSSRRARNP